MKVLIITPGRVPLPAYFGGAIEDYVLNLATELINLGVNVTILDYGKKVNKINLERLNNVSILRIPKYTLDVPLALPNLMTKAQGVVNELLWGISIKKFMNHYIKNKVEYNIIHFNSPIPLVTNSGVLKKDTKIVYTVHTYFGSRHAGTIIYRNLIGPIIERKAILNSTLTIALSSYSAKTIHELVGKQPYVVPLGVNISIFRPLKDKEKEKAFNILNINDFNENFIITFLGRISKQKGLEILIRSVKNFYDKGHRSFKVLIAGPISGKFGCGNFPSNYFLDLKKLITKLGLESKIKFLGNIHHNLRPLLLGISSVFVLPSYYETFGLVALEAMACGTPVIGSKVGSLPDIIKNGKNGFLIQSGDIDSLTRYLSILYSDFNLLFSMRKNAREEILNNYSWRAIAEKTLKLYLI